MRTKMVILIHCNAPIITSNCIRNCVGNVKGCVFKEETKPKLISQIKMNHIFIYVCRIAKYFCADA